MKRGPRHLPQGSNLTRRGILGACAALAVRGPAWAAGTRSLELIYAPTSLGLRPPQGTKEPGAWRAPAALKAAGLETALGATRIVALEHPRYVAGPDVGTRIRNGHAIRDFSLRLAATVRTSLEGGAFPVVIGGDCGVLLGGLQGARLAGGRGLVHVDGHSDFFHPGNYDTNSRLGSVAGMDLAAATGRGEELITRWPGIDGPLVVDEDAVQVGERDQPDEPGYYADILKTKIGRWPVRQVLKTGVRKSAEEVIARLAERNLQRAWLHIDFDVLDQSVMPAVDSPGSPGFTFAQLSEFVGALVGSGRIAGAEVAIYDPELDPEAKYAGPIVAALVNSFAPRNSSMAGAARDPRS